MKFVLIGVGALVALVLVVAIVGWMLPVKHHVTLEATFKAKPADVYSAITNVTEFPRWRSKLKSVEVIPSPGGERRFRETGGNGVITYLIQDAVQDTRLVTRIADDKLPFGGTWTYELSPAASGTTLRITEDGEVYNPIFRFMSRFVFGHTAGIETYLADLGRKLG